MHPSSVRALRADLATAVRRAEAGEATVVTVHGRPVAAIGPLSGSAAGTVTSSSGTPTIDQLVAAGAVLPPPRHRRWRPGDGISVWSGTRIDQALRLLRG